MYRSTKMQGGFALSMGFLSLAFFCFPLLSVCCAVVAIGFGIAAWSGDGRARGATGLAFGCVAFSFFLFGVIARAVFPPRDSVGASSARAANARPERASMGGLSRGASPEDVEQSFGRPVSTEDAESPNGECRVRIYYALGGMVYATFALPRDTLVSYFGPDGVMKP